MKEQKKNKLFLLFIAITFLTIIIDQVLKYLVLSSHYMFNQGFFSIHIAINSGAGFGILQGKTALLSFISFIVIAGIILFYQKIPQDRTAQILSGLFLGGVSGNFIDRITRGYVIDFIDFSFWPSFNIADAAISVAVVGLIWYCWRK